MFNRHISSHITANKIFVKANCRYFTAVAMNNLAKILIGAYITFSLIYLMADETHTTVSVSSDEKSANLNDTELKKIRNLIHKAGTEFGSSYDMVSTYLQSQLNHTYPSFWNVAVYNKKDWNVNFYLTGTIDDGHRNKRYYQVTEPENFTFSVLILETNNTSPSNSPSGNLEVNNNLKIQDTPQTIEIGGVTYTKKKSPYITSAQQAGIDLAMTTAYTWNKNIIDFTKVAQRLTETNLNQHWEVCTRYENLNQIGFQYSSVSEQWIQYIGYGLGSYVLHVYLYRNYING